MCWRSLGVPQMDPWGCVPVSASLGASGLWGHLPVCRGVEAGAGPGRAQPRDCRERGPQVPTSRPAPALRGIWRTEQLEEDTRKGSRNGGTTGVRGIFPGQPPSPCSERPWPPGPARGRLPLPRAGCAAATRVPSQPQFPERWRRTGGWRVPSPPSGLGRLSVLQRSGATECFPLAPCRTAARLPSTRSGAPSLRPGLSGGTGTASELHSHLPGTAPSAPPCQHCPQGPSSPRLRSAERRWEPSSPGSARPGSSAPKLQQVEPRG